VRRETFLGGAEDEGGRTAIVLDGRPAGLVSLAETRIAPDRPVLLRHVAEVEFGTGREQVSFRVNGKPAIGLAIAMRDAGEPVGLVKLRLFRPLPAAALRAALNGVRDAVVLDRNHSPGVGGILHQELRAVLCGASGAPRVHGLLAGVGGVNVPPRRIVEFVRAAREAEPAAESQWVR